MRYLSFFTVALVLGLSLSLVTLSTYPVQAATYYVDDDTCPNSGSGTQGDPFCSIQSGINAASSGDTVQVAAGTYNETITMKSGVVIQGAGQGVSIIDGGGNGHVVFADSVDSNAKLDGFTITNGRSFSGGGMYNYYSSPTITNCTFSGNMTSSTNGGGMANYYSSPTVTNCIFTGNTATKYGGGMYNNNSSPTVTNCTFTGNSATNNDPDYQGGGGGMDNYYSSPTVESCTFSGNTAYLGGGMFNNNSSPTITNCTFSANTAYMNGGGMSNYYSSSPTVTNCTFSVNTANNIGGGMSNHYSSSPTVTNCTFSVNTANNTGGGMLNYLSSPTVTNCILWGDTPQEITDSSSSPSVTYSDIQWGYEGTGNINADPMFVDPDGLDNVVGTEDDDFHLKSGSPCIDAGTATGAPDTDIEGKPRPVGTGYDMGAYEFEFAKAMPWIPLLLGD